MAQRRLTRAPAETAQDAGASATRPPWWAVALGIFAASRVVTTLLFIWVQGQATPQSRQGADPSLLDLATAWDGTWYWYIAVNGYPSVLPVTASGSVDTNQWAFLPLYPYLAKLLTFGVFDWRVSAVLLSVASGFVATVLLGALLLPHIGRSRALTAVAVFSCSPLAFLLQTTYAEALALALLLAALLLIDRRRYVAAILPTLGFAFTRPGVLALALAVTAQLAIRLVRSRRGGPPLPAGEAVGGVALAAVATAGGFAWSVIAAFVTGRPDAYFATENAWRSLWMPDGGISLFRPWWFAADFWSSLVVGDAAGRIAAPFVLLAVVGGFAALLLSRPARRLGSTAVLWCAAYGLYLLAVFFPQTSVFRLLMPMAPLAGVLTPRRPVARGLLLAACVALQALWLWVVVGPLEAYWTVP